MNLLKLQYPENIIKKAILRLLAGLIITGVFIIACSDKKTIDLGEFEAGVYTNSFFDMALRLPESWHVLDFETRMEIIKRGGKIIAGDNKRLKATMDTADHKSLNLLTAYESPPGAAVSSNPGIMLIAEKVNHAPGIKRGSDYYFHAKKLMKLGRIKVSYPKEIYEMNIDGVAFDVMETEITMGPGVVIRQRQYATIINQYALLVALIYQDENGLARLEEIVETITFN